MDRGRNIVPGARAPAQEHFQRRSPSHRKLPSETHARATARGSPGGTVPTSPPSWIRNRYGQAQSACAATGETGIAKCS